MKNILQNNTIVLTQIRSGGTVLDSLLSLIHKKKNIEFHNFWQYVPDAGSPKELEQQFEKIYDKIALLNVKWNIRLIIPELINLNNEGYITTPVISKLFKKLITPAVKIFLYRQDIEDWFLSYIIAEKTQVFHVNDINNNLNLDKSFDVNENEIIKFLDTLLLIKNVFNLIEDDKTVYIEYNDLLNKKIFCEELGITFTDNDNTFLETDNNGYPVKKLYSKNEKINRINNWSKISKILHNYCNYLGFNNSFFYD